MRRCGWAVRPTRRGLPAFAIVALFGIHPSWATAQTGAPAARSLRGGVEQALERFIGPPVATVRLAQEGQLVTEPDVLALVETKPGKPLQMEQVRETILHLFSLGRFQDIQVSADMAGGGLALTYDLVPLHVVDTVEFRGDVGLPGRHIRQALTDRFGRTPSAGQASAAATYLEALLHERGYRSASVTPRVEIDHERERSTLDFDVHAGRRAIVGAITVSGESVLSKAQVVERLGLEVGDPYDESAIDRGVARFVERIRNLGYYEAEVILRAEPFSEIAVHLIVTVRPGPKVTLVFEGDRLPAKELVELVPVKREGSVDEDLLEDSRRRIIEALRGRGYHNAGVVYRREPAGEKEVRIVFTVNRGRQYRVASIDVGGNLSVARTELDPLIALKKGDLFIDSRLTATTTAIRELLRRNGYANARVDRQVLDVPQPPGSPRDVDWVDVQVVAAEGLRTIVSNVRFTGNEDVPEANLREMMKPLEGQQPFYAPQVAEVRDAVHLHYRDLGYQQASVEYVPAFSDDRTSVELKFEIREGPQLCVGHIIIVGNTRTDRDIIEREIQLKPEEPLGLSKVIETQRRLTALGLFRRVRVTELPPSDPTHRDILVTVEEAPSTSVGYGAGVEASTRLRQLADGSAAERLEIAPRGFFEFGRRNLWGKNRSIDLFTRLSARPQQTGGGYGVNEYRGLLTYREPRTLGWNADAFVSAVVERAIRSSFSYNRRAVQAQLVRRVAPQISVSGHYSFERTKLFDERINPDDELLVDRLYPRVRLSSFSGSVLRDTRSDPLDPEKGLLLGMDTEVAGRAIGSQVGYAKVFGQAFWFRRLPGPRRIVFATGARLGLGRGFHQTVTLPGPVLGPGGTPFTMSIEEIPASERFFAGGDNTVRGFPLDRLGDDTTLDQNGVPTGGNAVLVFNGELRMPVWRDLGAVVFLDAGNVFARVNDLDLGRLRAGVGFGIRYQSPIGPLRFDVGFKLDRKTFANGSRERLEAFHISIGQAF